jgi:nucleoid-associated protein YgaU
MSALPVEMPSSEAVPADVKTVMRRVWAVPDEPLPELPSWLDPGSREGRGDKAGVRPVRAVRPRPGAINEAKRSRDAAARRGLRLTRRGRVVVAVTATLVAGGLCVAGATAAQATSGAASAHGAAGAAEQVVVRPGDTLWSIAKSADPGADTQTIVQQMLQVNRLAGAHIAPGQHLWVPRG